MITTAPEPINHSIKLPKIFLAGTIEMGNSRDWQSLVMDTREDVQWLNPRRKQWDSSWKQEITNSHFFQQVTWELNGIDESNLVFFNFEKDSKSPVSMLELGIAAKTTYVVVCCPPEFYRRGNIEIVCQREKIPLYDNLEDCLEIFKKDYKIWTT